MTAIIQHNTWVEVVNSDGERLFCHVTAEKAQRTLDQDIRDCGMAHLYGYRLPVAPIKACNNCDECK